MKNWLMWEPKESCQKVAFTQDIRFVAWCTVNEKFDVNAEVSLSVKKRNLLFTIYGYFEATE